MSVSGFRRSYFTELVSFLGLIIPAVDQLDRWRLRTRMSKYTVEIINRGEEVLYREGSRSLEAAYVDSELHAYDITHWATPTKQPLTETERQTVIERISDYLLACNFRFSILNEPPPPGPPPITGRDVLEYRKRLGIQTRYSDEF